jgi:hypothetical protein
MTRRRTHGRLRPSAGAGRARVDRAVQVLEHDMFRPAGDERRTARSGAVRNLLRSDVNPAGSIASRSGRRTVGRNLSCSTAAAEGAGVCRADIGRDAGARRGTVWIAGGRVPPSPPGRISRRRAIVADRSGAGDDQPPGLTFINPNAAPCGSLTIDMRPPGKSIGARSSFAPASSAARWEASTSLTLKYTSQ